MSSRPVARRARRAAITATVVGALAALTVPAVAAQSATPAAFGRAAELRLPGGSVADRFHSLHGLACTGRGDCVAGVAYNDSHGHQQAALITESHGSWGNAVQVRLPGDAAAQPLATINGVACPQPGSCVAVGNYAAGGTIRAFMVTESRGRWGRAVNPQLPANQVPSHQAFLQGIACNGAGTCAAVGSFFDKETHFEPMAVGEVHGHWQTAVELKVPANAGTLRLKQGYPLGVTCRSGGNCVTVGDYIRVPPTVLVAMGVTESTGKWAVAREISLPGNASSGSPAKLESVACLANGKCMGAGQYHAGSVVHAMTAVESNGGWSAAAELAAVPRGANFAILDGIACSGLSFCVSVGIYHRPRGSMQSLAVIWNGHWTGAGAVLPPGNAAGGRGSASLLTAVACVSSSWCEVLGAYRDKSGRYQAMAFTRT